MALWSNYWFSNHISNLMYVLFLLLSNFFPLVEMKIHAEWKKVGGEEKKGEKKAEYGAQESTEIELYWVYESVTIGKWV